MARDLDPAERVRDYFTVAEAATFLRLHVKTVERACRRGEIPGRRVGRRWQIPRADLLQALVGEWGSTSPALRPSLQRQTLDQRPRQRRAFISRPRRQPKEANTTSAKNS